MAAYNRIPWVGFSTEVLDTLNHVVAALSLFFLIARNTMSATSTDDLVSFLSDYLHNISMLSTVLFDIRLFHRF